MSALVSIICLTYNHEAYLRETLEGFVMQKTDFPFEALVHEDASTDGTAAILREYEAKYPEIIRPIYQTENQYSKPGVYIVKTFLLPRAEGKYFAVCDGDDPFTDPEKLQKQVDFLETHPEYSCCVHRARWHVAGTAPETDRIYPELSEGEDFTAEDIIRRGAGLFATNSFLIRREAYATIPETFRVPEVGDYTTLMYAAICGKVRCLPEVMSVHNDGVEGSWTKRVWDDIPKRIAQENAIITMLERVDAAYAGRYTAAIAEAKAMREGYIRELEYQALLKEGRLAEAGRPPYRELYRRDRRLARRAKLKKLLPGLVRFKRRLLGQPLPEEEVPHEA